MRNVTLSLSLPVILREPFACCHSERSEESDTAQDKLRDQRIPLRAGSPKGLRGNSKGVGLIEVIIALAILGIVAVAFLGGLSTSLKAVFISDERSTAQSLAQSQMEYVKNQDYQTASSGGEVTYLKIDLSEYPHYFIKSIDRNGTTVDAITGVPWDPEKNPPGPPADGEDHGLQKITVTIKHQDKEVFTLEDYKVNR